MATTTDLYGLGFSARQVTGLVAHGDLLRIHRGVYVDGRTRLSPWTQLKAALLAPAPGAAPFLSHRTAAAARSYRKINTRDIHITVVATSTPKIPGLTVHRSTSEPGPGPGPREVSLVSGLRVATLPRILVELAASAGDTELRDLITQGERHEALSNIATILDRHTGRPGLPRLTQRLAHHLPTPAYNSGFEQVFWAWYATEPDLPPPDETNLHAGPHEWDGVWRRERLVLELDSRRYHQAKQDMENDRIKDAYAQKRGMRVLRTTDTRFHGDRAAVREDLLAFLRPDLRPDA